MIEFDITLLNDTFRDSWKWTKKYEEYTPEEINEYRKNEEPYRTTIRAVGFKSMMQKLEAELKNNLEVIPKDDRDSIHLKINRDEYFWDGRQQDVYIKYSSSEFTDDLRAVVTYDLDPTGDLELTNDEEREIVSHIEDETEEVAKYGYD